MSFEDSMEEIFDRQGEDILEVIEEEVARRIKDFPIRIFLGSQEVDVDRMVAGEEIHISIENPVYFSETGKLGFVTEEIPKKMAI